MASDQIYLGNPLLKKANVEQEFTKKQVEEYIKCKEDPIYFVNPELTWQSKEKATYEEGCLSIPDQFAKIDRPEKCTVKFLDYNGNPKEIKAEGLLATCIQHEIDHLNGVLFIDYLSKLKKDIIIKKLSKNKKVLERIVV